MTLFGNPFLQPPAAKVEQPAAEAEKPEARAMHDRTFWDKLFKQEEYSDVTIKLSDRQITCHKAIICNRSEYFQKLCGKDSRFAESDQKIIELKDDNSDAVEAMLVHLYFGPYVAGNDTANGNDWRFHVEVSRAADKYLVHDLKSTAMARCLELLAAVIEMSQICDAILEIKRKYHDIDELMSKATALQQQHINALLQEPRFVESLSETEIREQFDRMRGLIGGVIQERDKLRGKLSGMVEKQGHICKTCGRIFDTSECKVRSCRGLDTKHSKYWVPKS